MRGHEVWFDGAAFKLKWQLSEIFAKQEIGGHGRGADKAKHPSPATNALLPSGTREPATKA